MKNLLYIALMLPLISCGKVSPEGDITTHEVKVQDFNKLDLEGKFTLFYVKDSINFVSVDTYPNIFENLEIYVKDNTLYISEKNETKGVDMYNITLYAKKSLSTITMRDSTNMTISSQMSEPEFNLNLTDRAKFSGSILANKVQIEMEKKSKANLLGRSVDAQLSIRDTATFIAPYWQVQNMNLNAANGTYTEFFVEANLKGSVDDDAELVYYGDPKKQLDITGKADVKQKKQP